LGGFTVSFLFIIMGHIEAQTQPAKQPVKTGNIGLGEWIAIFGRKGDSHGIVS
jgi:hypothetical protein